MERHYTPDFAGASLNKWLDEQDIGNKKPALPVFSESSEQQRSLVIFLPFHGIKKLIVGFGHLQFVDQEFHAIGFIHWMQDFA